MLYVRKLSEGARSNKETIGGMQNEPGERLRSHLATWDNAVANAYKQPDGSDDPNDKAAQFLQRKIGEQIHHKAITQALEPLYRNLSLDDQMKLTGFIETELDIAVGNNVLNMLPMIKEDHHDLHRYARSLGFENGNTLSTNAKSPELYNLMAQASKSSDLAFNQDIATQVLPDIMQLLDDRANDILQRRDALKLLDSGDIDAAIRAAGNNSFVTNALRSKISSGDYEEMLSRDVNKIPSSERMAGQSPIPYFGNRLTTGDINSGGDVRILSPGNTIG